MPLPLIPPPGADEWLGHWLLRIADRYGLSPDRFLHRLNVHPPEPPRIFAWPHPVGWCASQWQDFARHARIRSDSIQDMQAVVVALGRGSEHGFCPRCVSDALEGSGHSPFWRRAWMDATSTWCEEHGAPLATCPNVAPLAYRPCAFVRDSLLALAQKHRVPTAAWLEPLARDAAGLYPILRAPSLPVASASLDPGPVEYVDNRFHTLVDHVLVRLVSVVEDYDDAFILADHLGAPSPESLTHPSLPRRMERSHPPVLSQIRTLSQRIWLLGTAARIIGPAHAPLLFLNRTGASRETLRSWLWARLEAWYRVDLVRAVREATLAKLMVQWPAAQAWRSPTIGAQWFRRM